MRKVLTIVLFLASITNCSYAEPKNYFHSLSVKDGLSQLNVSCIIQDDMGLIWLGTRYGLNRYNGGTFEHYFHYDNDEKSLSDNYINCMIVDGDRNIWIGTENGLNRLGKDRRFFSRYYLPNNANRRSTIISLYLDRDSVIWVGTDVGLYQISRESEELEKFDVPSLRNDSVTAINENDGILYVGTRQHGLIIYNLTKGKVEKTVSSNSADILIPSNYVKDIYIDKNGNAWIGTENDGIFILPRDGSEPATYSIANGLSNNMVRCIRESPNGEIWVGTFDGLNIINPVTRKVTIYGSGVPGLLSNQSVYSICFDNMQTVWIGTFSGGVNYSSPYSHLFDFLNAAYSVNHYIGILGQSVQFGDFLYICSEGGGLIEYDIKSGSFRQYILPGATTKANSIIKSIYLDGDVIYCGDSNGQLYEYIPSTHSFSLKYQVPDHRQIYFIGKNKSGQFMLGTNSQNYGLILMKKGEWNADLWEFPVKGSSSMKFSNVCEVEEIEKNIYFIGSRNDGLFYYDMNVGSLTKVDKSMGLSAQSIYDIFKDEDNHIWVGCDKGLVEIFIPSWRVTIYNEDDGLEGAKVCKILKGEDNRLWMSTINGISSIDPQTGEILNYGQESDIQVEEFSLNSGTLLSDGRVIFSGNNGLEIFNPSDISTNPNIPKIVLDHLFVNNDLVRPGDSNGILTEDISTQKRIRLNYDETNLNIEYSALNYIFSNKSQYAYRLEGFDNDWIYVGSIRNARYTNIPPGNYIFRVKGSNNDGVWNEEGVSLEIDIKPPFWKTWWAYILYFMIVISLGWFIIRHFSERRRLQNSIEKKKIESELQNEYYNERSRMFTNFSHELRTPLSLIITPLQEIINRTDLPEDITQKNSLMLSNAKRMLRIVNNLMDLQKSESGALKLKISENDIVKFTQQVIDSFHDMAAFRKVQLSYSHSIDCKQMWFDWDLLEKVYFNFLSNAFKNVPDGGSIDVFLDVERFANLSSIIPENRNTFKDKSIEYLSVGIADSGSGIAQDELEKIFKPFYQVAQNPRSKSGTGIGLSLSKQIIEMHGGVVWADNISGSGAVFRFVIPIDKFKIKDAQEIELDKDKVVKLEVEVPQNTITFKNTGDKKYTVLVAEDNRDLNDLICSYLSEEYNAVCALDGQEAFNMSCSVLPDLIITDLMMPKMDGYELVQKLKTDANTSHIPIIMLTAMADSDDIKKGYATGADDYVTKPFDAAILKIRVSNLILSREQLKERYSKNFSLESMGIYIKSSDEKFMQKLYTVLQQNLSNSELNLDSFCKELGLSKSNLYRKIKQITGNSPNEFVRNFRLSTAAKMLKETDMSITDVYCAVGYNSLAYFSNSFKNLYGMSPTEYKVQRNKS